jgi:hypothetical protein
MALNLARSAAGAEIGLEPTSPSEVGFHPKQTVYPRGGLFATKTAPSRFF